MNSRAMIEVGYREARNPRPKWRQGGPVSPGVTVAEIAADTITTAKIASGVITTGYLTPYEVSDLRGQLVERVPVKPDPTERWLK